MQRRTSPTPLKPLRRPGRKGETPSRNPKTSAHSPRNAGASGREEEPAGAHASAQWSAFGPTAGLRVTWAPAGNKVVPLYWESCSPGTQPPHPDRGPTEVSGSNSECQMPAALRGRRGAASAVPCSGKLCCSHCFCSEGPWTLWAPGRCRQCGHHHQLISNVLAKQLGPAQPFGSAKQPACEQRMALPPRRPRQRPRSVFLSGEVPPEPLQRRLRICSSHPTSDSGLPSKRQSAGQSCDTKSAAWPVHRAGEGHVEQGQRSLPSRLASGPSSPLPGRASL